MMFEMLVYGIAAGVCLYGVLLGLSGRSKWLSPLTKSCTEKSVSLFCRLCGAALVVLGLGIIGTTIGMQTLALILVKWIGIDMIWLALAMMITFYIVILKKK